TFGLSLTALPTLLSNTTKSFLTGTSLEIAELYLSITLKYCLLFLKRLNKCCDNISYLNLLFNWLVVLCFKTASKILSLLCCLCFLTKRFAFFFFFLFICF